jgi:hypothetical protein
MVGVLFIYGVFDFGWDLREVPAQCKCDASVDVIPLFVLGQFVDCRIVTAVRRDGEGSIAFEAGCGKDGRPNSRC